MKALKSLKNIRELFWPLLEKAKESEKVKKWLENKKIVKEIYVKGRLVSIVINS